MIHAYLMNELHRNGIVRFYIRAKPNAAHNKILEVMDDESIKVAIAAPAEGGKANAELIRFLAGTFGVSKGQVKIVSGKTVRTKLVEIKQ
jgi:uncharacterized protein (TIGR00251 family)